MDLSGGAASQGPRHAKLGPFDFAGVDDIPYASFSKGQPGTPGLDLDKNDAPQLTFGQAVKDHQVYRAAEKANILRIVGEHRKVWGSAARGPCRP